MPTLTEYILVIRRAKGFIEFRLTYDSMDSQEFAPDSMWICQVIYAIDYITHISHMEIKKCTATCFLSDTYGWNWQNPTGESLHTA